MKLERDGRDDALFDDLMKEFQHLDVPSPDLVRAVDRGQKKLVRGIAAGVVATTVLCTAGVCKIVLEPRAESYFFGFMQIGFAVTVMAFVLWSQRNSWSARAATTRAFLVLELERRRDSMRRMTFLRVGCPTLALLTGLWHVLLFHEVPLRLAGTAIGAVGVVTPYVVFAGLFVHAGRRRALFARQADGLVRQVTELDDTAPPAL